jgi:hypothetical protein
MIGVSMLLSWLPAFALSETNFATSEKLLLTDGWTASAFKKVMSSGCTFQTDIDFKDDGTHFGHVVGKTQDAAGCCTLCAKDDACAGATWCAKDTGCDNECWVKTASEKSMGTYARQGRTAASHSCIEPLGAIETRSVV